MRKNKKIICFLDESGTPGDNDFSFGVLMLYASDIPMLEEKFLRLLENKEKEFHSKNYDFEKIKRKITELNKKTENINKLFFSYKKPIQNLSKKDRSKIYALTLAEAIKLSIYKFKKITENKVLPNNIDIIVDDSSYLKGDNHHEILDKYRKEDKLFKHINMIVRLDSCISRSLQISDAIAYLGNKYKENGFDKKTISNSLNIKFI